MSTVEHDHTIWESSFSEERRRQQLEEDSNAWRAVTGILLTIVSVGACLAVFSVLVCL
ncbi:MAG: hypothetical protein H8E66_14370 [Planctomycetes bacterium]|nr:hypothetical protein [Planctomycetota bacterium]